MSPTLLTMLALYEWSSWAEGPGSGPHDSGPGSRFDACPACHGLKECSAARTCFVASAFGHRRGCELEALLKKLTR